MRRLTLLARLAFFSLVLCGVGSVARADDPFTVKGIGVDASASSATEAQTIAINSGRGRAWTTLYRRLTKAQDWPRQPALDDAALQRIIRNYLPANERRSTTRYVASMTYVFNADAVRRIIRHDNIAYTDMQAKPILVVPMAPDYQPHAAWTAAWSNPHYAQGAVSLVLPADDAVNAAALGALKFATASWQDVEPVASRLHATEAWLVLAQTANGQLTVKLRRLGPGSSPTIPDITVPVPAKTPAAKAYASAGDAAANAIVDAWKGRSSIDFGKHSKLLAEVRIESLGAWSAMLQRLATVPTVTEVGIVAMNTGEARIAISYAGTPDQLTQLMAQAGFELSNAGGTWWLAAQHANADADSK